MISVTNEDVIDDLMKRRADRISKLFPPCILAYSFLLKSKNFKLTIDELYDNMMKFPQVPDARKIFLSPEDTKLFDFQDVDLFQISLLNFISLDKDELSEVLNNYYFNILSDEICILNPPEIDVAQTLLVFRHLYPEMSESEMLNELNEPRFIAYYHYHKLDFDSEEFPIPELQPPESFYYFNEMPTPEKALLSIFCANRTNQMNLIDIQQIKRSTEIYIGPEKNAAYMNTTIDDIFSLVEKSHIFYFVDNTIQVYPPLILSNYFEYHTEFFYRPNANPCLVYSADEQVQKDQDDESTSQETKTNSLYPFIVRILQDIGTDVHNFTFLQIFEHVYAQRIGCDHLIFGEEDVSVEDLKNGILKWFDEYAEKDLISNFQKSQNSNNEMLEERRKKLASTNLDQRNDELNSQMLIEYPFLGSDETVIPQQDDGILYKLKGT